jgi:type III pantothenate kinase
MKVIATGGLAPLFDQGFDLFDAIEDDLTMHGLRLIHDFNNKETVHG